MPIPIKECDVIAGNVGAVAQGVSTNKAHKIYAEYVRQSKWYVGSRVLGEPVWIVRDGEVMREYIPNKRRGK